MASAKKGLCVFATDSWLNSSDFFSLVSINVLPIDLVIFKVDSAGTFLWEQTYGSPNIDIGYEIIKSVDNNGFIITGKTFASGSEQYYVLKLNNTPAIVDKGTAR